jgi:hypothetical protein
MVALAARARNGPTCELGVPSRLRWLDVRSKVQRLGEVMVGRSAIAAAYDVQDPEQHAGIREGGLILEVTLVSERMGSGLRELMPHLIEVAGRIRVAHRMSGRSNCAPSGRANPPSWLSGTRDKNDLLTTRDPRQKALKTSGIPDKKSSVNCGALDRPLPAFTFEDVHELGDARRLAIQALSELRGGDQRGLDRNVGSARGGRAQGIRESPCASSAGRPEVGCEKLLS